MAIVYMARNIENSKVFVGTANSHSLGKTIDFHYGWTNRPIHSFSAALRDNEDKFEWTILEEIEEEQRKTKQLE